MKNFYSNTECSRVRGAVSKSENAVVYNIVENNVQKLKSNERY